MKDTHMKALKAIFDNEPVTTYKLGKIMGMSSAGAKKRADPLIEKGWVEKEWREEGNTLKRYYTITNLGKKTLKENLEDELERTRAALEAFKDEEDDGDG